MGVIAYTTEAGVGWALDMGPNTFLEPQMTGFAGWINISWQSEEVVGIRSTLRLKTGGHTKNGRRVDLFIGAGSTVSLHPAIWYFTYPDNGEPFEGDGQWIAFSVPIESGLSVSLRDSRLRDVASRRRK